MMDYYQNVVMDYLRADRGIFLNTEYCLQINHEEQPAKGSHWYCDAVALDFRKQTVFLCEVSYAEGLAGLIKRLKGWHENWDEIRLALGRNSSLRSLFSERWTVRPWLFVPKKSVDHLVKQLDQIWSEIPPVIRTLEAVQPWTWHYCGGSLKDEGPDPSVPKKYAGPQLRAEHATAN